MLLNHNKKIFSFKNKTKINLNKTSKYFLKNKSYNTLRIKTYFNSIQQSIICNSKENIYLNISYLLYKYIMNILISENLQNIFL